MIKPALIISLLLLASSSVLACNPDQGTGQCGYRGANGAIYNSYGEAQNSYQQRGAINNSSVRIIKQPDSFAALAQATSGRTFSVTHMHSTTEAKNSVIRKCEQSTGEKCIVAHAFRNGCMSAASGMLKNGRYRLFPASAPTGGEAEVKAMAACKAAGLYDCLLTFEVPECSFS
jgi:hypothetical protein